MKIEKFDADTFMISDVPRLDPITVMIRNYGEKRGQLTLVCYGAAWSTYWGSMGFETVQEFLGRMNSEYVAGCLIWSRRQFITNRRAEGRETEYLVRIVDAVLEALKVGEKPFKCGECQDKLCGGTGIFDGHKCDGIPF